MMLPILYTVLTTICAFLSLIFSGIKPIIDFGWMMTLGIIGFYYSNLFVITIFIKFIFSLENEINLKNTEKSLITSALGSVAKRIIYFYSVQL